MPLRVLIVDDDPRFIESAAELLRARGFAVAGEASAEEFDYSFETLYELVLKFVDKLGLGSFSIYIQDYGAPIGLRIAQRHPERIDALITQSGNAYVDGFTPFWEPLFAYASDPNPETEAEVRKYLTHEAAEWQWTHGTRDPENVSPDTWTLDNAYLDRPGNREIQLGLFPRLQEQSGRLPSVPEVLPRPPAAYAHRVGPQRRDIRSQGRRGLLRDLPDAELHLLDTGHFALEEQVDFIAEKIDDFLCRHIGDA